MQLLSRLLCRVLLPPPAPSSPLTHIIPLTNRLQVTSLPPDMAGKKAVRGWMTRLHGMPASHELGEEDVRQLLFDLESAYNEFIAALPR